MNSYEHHAESIGHHRRSHAAQQLDGAVRRLYFAAAILALVVVIGAEGYHLLGEGRWSWLNCAYMTVITLSTVGFGETLVGMDEVPLARLWTLMLIFMGSGTLLYFISMLTATIVEGDVEGVLRERRMNRKIDGLRNHFIVCGAGQNGIHVIEELIATKSTFVVVDSDDDRLNEIAEALDYDLLYVLGDATEDHCLTEAGIAHASGLTTTLPDDRDNLFVVVTARSLAPGLRIVAKAVDPRNVAKMKRSGANVVVSPYYIGGMRMANELLRPAVVRFLDRMRRQQDKNLRIEEVAIGASSHLAGKRLMDSGIRDIANVLVLAIHRLDTDEYTYAPGPEDTLDPGQMLVVLGGTDDIAQLRGVAQPGDDTVLS